MNTILVWLLAFIAGVAAHETGHYLLALAYGFRPKFIREGLRLLLVSRRKVKHVPLPQRVAGFIFGVPVMIAVLTLAYSFKIALIAAVILQAFGSIEDIRLIKNE